MVCMHLPYCMCRLEEIGAAATKEYSLEKAMEKMGAEWQEMEFVFLDYRDTVSVVSLLNQWVVILYIYCTGYLHIISCG